MEEIEGGEKINIDKQYNQSIIVFN